jgi:hypothetical protein
MISATAAAPLSLAAAARRLRAVDVVVACRGASESILSRLGFGDITDKLDRSN